MDGTDLLGLFQAEDNGTVEPLFPVENFLMESWLSEQDVRLRVFLLRRGRCYFCNLEIEAPAPCVTLGLFVCLDAYVTRVMPTF